MIHCYLSDTALIPPSPEDSSADTGLLDNTTYNQFTDNGLGVGQVTERVLSIFSTKYSAGLITDPRTSVTSRGNNKRISKLFKFGSNYIPDYRCLGQMCLHYDKYFAENNSNDAAHIASMVDSNEIACLFNVIETCVFSHEYDSGKRAWVFQDAETLNEILTNSFSSASTGYGYVENSLNMPNPNATSKKARVKFVSTHDLTESITTVGSDAIMGPAPILFPSWICFDYLTGDNHTISFKIYLDPKTLIDNYPHSYIGSIIFPTDPADLMNMDYTTVNESLSKASNYVGNVMTGTVTKTSTNVLDTTNYTGAVAFTTGFAVGDNETVDLTFTLMYKGCKPSDEMMRSTIRDYLTENYPDQATAIDTILPDLRITSSFIIIPFYNTRSVVNLQTNYTICDNILNLGYINRIVNSTSIDPRCTTLLNVAGYNMHALAYPVVTGEHLDIDSIPSKHGLDSIGEFKTYQAVSTESPYFDVMTDQEQKLNLYLSKIVASELFGYAPLDISYVLESRDLSGVQCSFYSFTIGGVNFAVITLQSFNNLMGA